MITLMMYMVWRFVFAKDDDFAHLLFYTALIDGILITALIADYLW